MTKEEMLLKLKEIKSNTKGMMKDESDSGDVEKDKG